MIKILIIGSIVIIPLAIIWFLWVESYGTKSKGEPKEYPEEEYPEEPKEEAYLDEFVTNRTLIYVAEGYEEDTEKLDNRVKELEEKIDIIIKYNNLK